jgi:hypothetical protein
MLFSEEVDVYTENFTKVVSIKCRAFSPEGGVGLVPKRGFLLTLAYYAFPR